MHPGMIFALWRWIWGLNFVPNRTFFGEHVWIDERIEFFAVCVVSSLCCCLAAFASPRDIIKWGHRIPEGIKMFLSYPSRSNPINEEWVRSYGGIKQRARKSLCDELLMPPAHGRKESAPGFGQTPGCKHMSNRSKGLVDRRSVGKKLCAFNVP